MMRKKKDRLPSSTKTKLRAYQSIMTGVSHITGISHAVDSTFPPKQTLTRARGVHEASHHMLMSNVIGGSLILFDAITTRIFLETIRKVRDTNNRLPPLRRLLSCQKNRQIDNPLLLLLKFENLIDCLADNWKLTQEGYATFRALRYSRRLQQMRSNSMAKGYKIAEKIERKFGAAFVYHAANFASQVPLYDLDFLASDEEQLRDQIHQNGEYSPDLRFAAISRIDDAVIPGLLGRRHSASPRMFFDFLFEQLSWKMASNKIFVDWSLRFIQQLPLPKEVVSKIDRDFRMDMSIHFGDTTKIIGFLKQRPRTAATVVSAITRTKVSEQLAMEKLADEETAKKAALYYLSVYPPVWIYEYDKPIRVENEYESAYIAMRPDIAEDKNMIEWILSKEVIERIKSAYLKGEKQRVGVFCFVGLIAKCNKPELCLPYEISNRLSDVHLWIRCFRESYIPDFQKS